MTDEEKRLQEELIRKINEVHEREAQQQQWSYNQGKKSAGQQAEEEYYSEHVRLRYERVQAARRAAEIQQAIDEAPRQKYAVIVAIDQYGGFARAGKMPWHFPADLKWFKQHTQGQIVVMGRATYEDINAGSIELAVVEDKPIVVEQVLPGRKCFVLSKTLNAADVPNATVIKNSGEWTLHLEDEDLDKTIFFIGGERVFTEGIALADMAYVTVINADYQCDRHFPVAYLQEHFIRTKRYKNEDAPALRWTVWRRKAS